MPNILRRQVPDPLKPSGADLTSDSLVRANWTCRTELPDPLADPEGGPRIRVEATLYGEDVIAADLAQACRADSLARDSCLQRKRAEYATTHQPESRFRIQLNMESTFSVNSLQPRFWDIYIKDEQDIALEPMQIIPDPPVIVREDSLPEPGRAPVRAGLYRRSINLYFPLNTPFGIETLGPDVREIRLIISREQKELANLVWEIRRDGVTTSSSPQRRRIGGGNLDF